MADIIELEVVGKVTGLKPMLSTVSRLEREIVKSTRALDQNKISQDRYNKVLLSAKREYMALGVSAQKANGQVTKMANATKLASAAQTKEIALNKQYAVARRDATAANARHTAEKKQANAVAAQAIATEERLKNKFVQGYAAMDVYTKELNDLSMARKANIISTAQQTAGVERLNMQMAKGTGAFSGYSGGVAQAGRSTNQLGVVAQQTGYQVGDFLVQIQSGANPMMAFGQQATQLVGVLPLLSDQLGMSAGKLMGIAAGLGIAIPLITAVAGFMLKSGDAAKSLKESLDDLSSFNDDFRDFGKSFGVDLVGNIEAVRKAFGDLVADVYDARLNELQGKIAKEFSGGLFSDSFSRSMTEIEPSSLVYNQQERINEQAQQELVIQEQINKLINTRITDQGQLNGLYNDVYTTLSASGDVSEAGLEVLREIAVANGIELGIRKDIVSTEEDRVSALEDTNDLLLAGRDATLDRNRLNIQTIRDAEAQLGMLHLILQSGEDSVEVARARALQEAISLNLTTANQEKYIDVELAIRATEKAIEDKNTASEESLATAQEMLETMRYENQLQQEINDHGKDSVEVTKMRAAQELLVFSAMLDTMGIVEGINGETDELRKHLIESKLAALDLDAAAAAIDFANALSGAESLAHWLGVSLSAALQLRAITPAMADEDAAMSMQVIPDASVRAAQRAALENYKRLTEATKDAGGASSDAADDLDKLREALEKEVRTLEEAANPLLAYTTSMERLNELFENNSISSGAYTKAVDDLNKGLIESHPLVDGVANAFQDFMERGFKDFSTFASDILDLFKNMLIEMAMTALRNKILIPMVMGKPSGGIGGSGGGMGGGGMGKTLMGGISAGFGGGGVAGLTGLGALGGGMGASASALLTGGPSMMMSSIGGQVAAAGAATAGAGATMAAIGAVAAPLLAVAAVFMAFKKKTKVLESGMRLTVNGMDSLVEGFKKVETSRFFGLSKKVTHEFDAMAAATADPLSDVVRDLQQSVVDAAAQLGVGAEAFKGFSRSFILSTKDMTDDEAQAALQAELMNTQNAFANMIPTLTDWSREGEATTATLTRLVASLTNTRNIFSQLGLTTDLVGVAGAGAATIFTDLFGSLENANTAASNYFKLFYSETEQVNKATENMTTVMSALGVVLPKTIEGFRNLVEQADRMGNTQQVGQLIAISGAFASMIDGQNSLSAGAKAADLDAANAALDIANDNLATATSNLEASFSREMEATRASFQVTIDGLNESLTGAREKQANSKAIASALSNSLDGRIFPSVEAERQSQDEAAAYLKSLVGNPITDTEALQEALSIVADPSTDTYRTLEEYRRDFNRTSVVISELEKAASLTLSADERAVVLLEQQIKDTQMQSDKAVDLLQQQLDSLLGIKGSILNLSDAITAFAVAASAAATASAAVNTVNTAGAGTSGFGASTAAGEEHAGKAYSANWSNEQWYLANNPDVLAAVARGQFTSATDHYLKYGQAEGRSFAGGGYTGDGARAGGLDGQGGFMAMLHPQEDVIDRTRPTPKSSNEAGSSESMYELRREISDLRVEQRQILMDISKNTKRTSDIERKHDVQGTPPVRAA
jgi:hypothetical protein